VIKRQPKDDYRLISADAPGITAASKALRDGDLVAFPSETVYGLGAEATNDLAVAKIYTAKGRPTFNPLIVHVPSVEAAQRYVVFDDRARRFCEEFCPGAVSVVLPRRPDCTLSLLVSAGLESVAIRIPNHPVAQAVLIESNVPIAAPSANPSGAVSPTRADHVLAGWPDPDKEGPKFVIDGGNCSIGLESTVIDLSTAAPTLLRPGGISIEDIEQKIGPIAIAIHDDDAPKSPGMLSRHYAPETPIRLNTSDDNQDAVYIGFGPGDANAEFNLSVSGDLQEAAANLFSMLRQVDLLGKEMIAVAPIPTSGLGLAINDRLSRAALRD